MDGRERREGYQRLTHTISIVKCQESIERYLPYNC